MKIGIFDSGLGGLIVARAIRREMPEYDYVYLGDTKRVPYGNRSHQAVYEFTKEGVKYLFEKENCAIVILACNTASARVLKEIQINLKDKRVLGVLIPAVEECAKYSRVGIMATTGTVVSDAFPNEIRKLNKKTKVFQNPAPMLVPLAEEGETKLAKEFLKKYLKPILAKKVDALALGCTHYPIFKNEIKKIIGKKVRIISQDEIVPKKLKNYLIHHPEIYTKLSKGRSARILVTDKTQTIDKLTQKWFGDKKPKLIKL